MASFETTAKRPRLSVVEDSQEITTGRPNSTDNSDTSGSRDGRRSTEQNVPRDVRRWTEKDLQRLSISTRYVENVSPTELIALFPLESKKDNRIADRLNYINIIEFYFKNFCHFHNHLDGEINTLQRNPRVYALRNRYLYATRHYFEMEEYNLKDSTEDLKFWFQRFEVNGMKFGEMLYKILLKRDLFDTDGNDHNKELSGYDFQFLFEAFASMFGLDSSWSEPCIHSSTLQLSRAKIFGKPDILFCWNIAPDAEGAFEEHLNIVAVCSVKKKTVCDSDQDSQRVRSPEAVVSSTEGDCLPPHLPLTLLGQHGGQLLIQYQNSSQKNVIFGIIVQGTKVSFTALKMTSVEYHGIIAGKPAETRPELLITKPYDFLVKSEREHLIRPLLVLGMMQELKLQ